MSTTLYPSVQLQRFPDGGFVLHKLRVFGRFASVWFAKDGTVTDAEYSHGRRSNRRLGQKAKLEAQRLGNYWRLSQQTTDR